MTNLPPAQQRLFDALKGQGDVKIDVIFAAVYPDWPEAEPRYKQQRLGPVITRLNRRIAKDRMAVKPGDIKSTYRLTLV